MSDLIIRGMAIAYACSGLVRRMDDGDWRRVEDIREDLKNMPSEYPEIIHCENCKHRTVHEGGYEYCHAWLRETHSDWYCSRGERT